MPLARLPTPIERLERFSAWLGAEVWIKRDDLTGLELSGNKVRKLEFHLAAALDAGCDAVVTCGGVQSNHCRATALAARKVGLEPTLVLRGRLPEVPDGNLLLDRLAGARIVPCTPEEYGERGAPVLAAAAATLRAEGRRPWVVPEGGSDALGALGYASAADEVTMPFDHVFVAVGSGGTLAGLAAGAQIGTIHGVAVCDDAPTFERIVKSIGRDLPAYGRELHDDWRVVEGYQGPGYAQAGPEVWDLVRTLARLEGVLVDPVYTGKALHGLVGEVRAGRAGGRVLFWHTGGSFGLFGRGAEALS